MLERTRAPYNRVRTGSIHSSHRAAKPQTGYRVPRRAH